MQPLGTHLPMTFKENIFYIQFNGSEALKIGKFHYSKIENMAK